jgi:hypothetical protein
MKNLLLLLFTLNSLVTLSQPKEQNSLVTVRGNIGIPKPISSRMFKTSFNGVFEANLSVCYRLFDNFHAGLGYQNSYFQNNEKVFVYYTVPAPQKTGGATLSYNTRLMGHSGFVRLGYDKFFSKKGYMSYALNTGFMKGGYLNVIPDTSDRNKPLQPAYFVAPFIQPEAAANFIVDPTLSFSIMLSYTTVLRTFDPRSPRFNHIGQVNTASNGYMMSWFNIGFGFNVLINGK